MKCLKCGAETPADLPSGICPPCLETANTGNQWGCLFLLPSIGALIVVMFLVNSLGFWSSLLWDFIALFLAAIITALWLPSEPTETDPKIRAFGPLSLEMVCPHCKMKGSVRRKVVQKEAGISGKKATAAALTAGLSIIATGLSRKETVTQARCDNCKSFWAF
jgi:hypothetical protein